jgi:hypothetical protein
MVSRRFGFGSAFLYTSLPRQVRAVISLSLTFHSCAVISTAEHITMNNACAFELFFADCLLLLLVALSSCH